MVKHFLAVLALSTAFSNLGQAAQTDTVRIAALTEIPHSLSPFFAAGPDAYLVIHAIFDSLVETDTDGNLQPGLAEKWERVGKNQYRFQLRKGVRFHTGEELTSKDVVATFALHLGHKIQSTRHYIFASIDKVVAEGKYGVRFFTKTPDHSLPNKLVLFSGIVPASMIQNASPSRISKIHVGAGPYRLKRIEKNKRIVLAKNPNYWRKGLPKSKELVFEIMPREKWRSALLAGDVDVVPNFPGKEARLLVSEPNIKVIKKPVVASHWIMLNNRSPVLKDERVRLAINLALDRKDLIEFAAYGNGQPLSTIPNSLPSPIPLQYPYDIERAKKLLSEAGFTGEIALHGWVTDVSEMIARMIQKQLSVVGIKFEYEVMSSADYAKRFQVYRVNKAAVPKGLDFIVNLVGNPIGHPGFHYLCLMSSDGIQSLTNEPTLDTMLSGYFDAADASAQDLKLQEIGKYVFDHALIAPTYQVKSITAFRSNVILEDVSEDGNFIGPFISKIKKRAP